MGSWLQLKNKKSAIGRFFVGLKCGTIGIFFVILRVINNVDIMTTGNIIRFACILLLWLALCYILLTRAARIDFMVIFAIVASGIIVFVPLYKKYVRRKD